MFQLSVYAPLPFPLPVDGIPANPACSRSEVNQQMEEIALETMHNSAAQAVSVRYAVMTLIM